MNPHSSPGFYPDYRLGGVRRLVYCHPEDLMRVSDELLESVCFICTEDSSGQVTVRGTAFFVSFPAEKVPGAQFDYLITARHNVEKSLATGDKLVLRINNSEGGVETADIVNLVWHYPDNSAA